MTQAGLAVPIGLYALACAIAFWRLDTRTAAIGCYLAGWLLLPVGIFPESRFTGPAPIDVMPLALPSRMLWSKAAIVPVVVCLFSLAFDGARWRTLRPRAIDAAVLAFCLYPAVQGLWADSRPGGLAQAAYLLSAWGGTWLLGRLYVAGAAGPPVLLRALMWAGVALLPVAIIEAVAGPILYQSVYGPHAFAADGVERYLGYRPLGAFENGNQYGLWIALAALAAIAVARSEPARRPIAAVLVLAALASQSVGAIGLLLVGIALLFSPPELRRRGLAIGAIGGAIGLALIAVLIVIGGERVVDAGIQAFRMIGRGSFPWRVSQDLKALAAIGDYWVWGSGQWDWWIARASRPWDLPMLVIGQYGAVGLLLLLPLVAVPAVRLVAGPERVADRDGTAIAILAVLAMVDALLNAFIFMPTIMIAGGLVAMRDRAGRPE